MLISFLGNCNYVLNVYFKSEKFKNTFSPNRILSLNLLLSYLKKKKKKWYHYLSNYSVSELSLTFPFHTKK